MPGEVRRREDGTGFLGAGVIDGCKPPCGRLLVIKPKSSTGTTSAHGQSPSSPDTSHLPSHTLGKSVLYVFFSISDYDVMCSYELPSPSGTFPVMCLLAPLSSVYTQRVIPPCYAPLLLPLGCSSQQQVLKAQWPLVEWQPCDQAHTCIAPCCLHSGDSSIVFLWATLGLSGAFSSLMGSILYPTIDPESILAAGSGMVLVGTE